MSNFLVDKRLQDRCQRPAHHQIFHFIIESNEPIGHFVHGCEWGNVYFKPGQPVSLLLKSSDIVIMTR